jgi:hypothetical protein
MSNILINLHKIDQTNILNLAISFTTGGVPFSNSKHFAIQRAPVWYSTNGSWSSGKEGTPAAAKI